MVENSGPTAEQPSDLSQTAQPRQLQDDTGKEKPESRSFWRTFFISLFVGIAGAVLSGWGVWLAYSFERQPRLGWQLVNQTPVFQSATDIPDLSVKLGERDLLKEGMQITTVVVRIINNGETDIGPDSFASAMPVTISVKKGGLIRPPAIAESEPSSLNNSDLLNYKSNAAIDGLKRLKEVDPNSDKTIKLLHSTFDEIKDSVLVSPFILNRNEWFTVSLVILHSGESEPVIEVDGHLKGIKQIEHLTGQVAKTESIIPRWLIVTTGILTGMLLVLIRDWLLRTKFVQSRLLRLVIESMLRTINRS